MIPVERNFLELRDIKKLKFNSPKEKWIVLLLLVKSKTSA